MAKKFYITTPIYYVNDVPHIGHTCTTVAADILARYHKLLGEDVFFLTGTDEHGAKVAEEAAKAKLTPLEFCDKVSKTFSDIWPKLDVEYDYFIRTTNPKHENVVSELLQKIYDNGDIYKKKYEGWYCIGCEKFLTDVDIVNGRCPLHSNKELEWQSEANYFFKLSKYIPNLIDGIENASSKFHYLISPAAKREEVLSKLKLGVGDLSISRANVPWGIPIPWDKTQTIYVWVDALINYFSALKINKKEEFWPANLHLIGKEILWFHAVIWEAMLISAEVAVPKGVFAHSFYMIDGAKMSKSLGNVISPGALLEKFGVDGTRYLVASSFPYADDSDVGIGKFTEKYNADLANGLGNLVARVLSMAERYYEGKIPDYSGDYKQHPLQVLERDVWKRYDEAFSEYRLGVALEDIWVLITAVDKYIDENKPWEMVKKGKTDELSDVIYALLGTVKDIAWLIYPFMPETAREIGRRLGVEAILEGKPVYKDSWTDLKQGTKTKTGPPLFPRI